MASGMGVSSSSGPESYSRKTAPAAESGYPEGSYGRATVNLFGADAAVRAFLLAVTIAALVLVLTSKQTELVPTGLPLPFPQSVPVAAKFQNAPAFIYNVAALAVTCFYAAVTLAVAVFSAKSPSPSTRVLFHLLLLDILVAGVMSSATGASGAVAYIGLKGDEHVRWNKICGVYGSFCRHIGSAVVLSLAASVALVVLAAVSSYSLYRRSR